MLAADCPLGGLDDTLVAAGHSRDEAAVAWLYARSYDALHHSSVSLETRLTLGAMESAR